jgi:hypothetical protein
VGTDRREQSSRRGRWHGHMVGLGTQLGMPIPAAPTGRSDIASTLLRLFEQLHAQVRQEISDLDDAGLNWSPGPSANAIATIVTHMVGSEAETLRCVAGVPCVRDREDEFSPRQRTVSDVLGELQAADVLIEELESEITRPRLRRHVTLPTLPAEERRSGLTWLAGNYGHAREHLGHIQLTKQLFLDGVRTSSDHPVPTFGSSAGTSETAPMEIS